MRKRDKVLTTIIHLGMPIGIIIVLIGMLVSIIRAYFLAGYTFWREK